MTTSQTNEDLATTVEETPPPAVVFDDPVAYLGSFGVASELVGETTIPAAA